MNLRSRDSVAGITIVVRGGWFGVRIPVGKQDCSPKCPDGLWDPPLFLISLKWSGSEVNCPPVPLVFLFAFIA